MNRNYGSIRRGRMGADVVGERFTQILNSLFRDQRLTPQAMGVFGNLSTHAAGHGVSIDGIAQHMNCGVETVKSALRELEKYGYLARDRERGPNGRLGAAVYVITDMPGGLSVNESAPYPTETPEPVAEPPAASPLVADPPPGGADNRRSEPKTPKPAGAQPPPVSPTQVEPTIEKTRSTKNNTSPLRGDVYARDAQARTRTRTHEGTTNAQTELDTGPAGSQDPTTRTKIGDEKPTAAGSVRQKRKVPWPGSFVPSVEQTEWATRHFPVFADRPDLLAQETGRFNAYWDVPERRGAARDWPASWRTWVQKSVERGFAPAALQTAPAGVADEVAETVDKWWAFCAKRGPILRRTKLELLQLVTLAVNAGATVAQVREALKACDEAVPHPERFERALHGGVQPVGVSRRQVETDAMFDRAAQRAAALDKIEAETGQEVSLLGSMMAAARNGEHPALAAGEGW